MLYDQQNIRVQVGRISQTSKQSIISGALPSPRIMLGNQEPSSLSQPLKRSDHAWTRTHAYHAQKRTIYLPSYSNQRIPCSEADDPTKLQFESWRVDRPLLSMVWVGSSPSVILFFFRLKKARRFLISQHSPR